MPVPDHVVRYAVDAGAADPPEGAGRPDFVRKYVSWGAGPRASQYLVGGQGPRRARGPVRRRREDVRAVARRPAPPDRHQLQRRGRGHHLTQIVEQLLEPGEGYRPRVELAQRGHRWLSLAGLEAARAHGGGGRAPGLHQSPFQGPRRVRRAPGVRARRRAPAHRLEGVRQVRQVLPEAIRGRDEPQGHARRRRDRRPWATGAARSPSSEAATTLAGHAGISPGPPAGRGGRAGRHPAGSEPTFRPGQRRGTSTRCSTLWIPLAAGRRKRTCTPRPTTWPSSVRRGQLVAVFSDLFDDRDEALGRILALRARPQRPRPVPRASTPTSWSSPSTTRPSSSRLEDERRIEVNARDIPARATWRSSAHFLDRHPAPPAQRRTWTTPSCGPTSPLDAVLLRFLGRRQRRRRVTFAQPWLLLGAVARADPARWSTSSTGGSRGPIRSPAIAFGAAQPAANGLAA